MHFVSPGPGKLSVSVENPDGSQTDVLVTDNGNGNFTITWTAEMVGKHKVVVKFGGKPVPGSPFAVSALMKVSTNDAVFVKTAAKLWHCVLCFPEGCLSYWPVILLLGYRLSYNSL